MPNSCLENYDGDDRSPDAESGEENDYNNGDISNSPAAGGFQATASHLNGNSEDYRTPSRQQVNRDQTEQDQRSDSSLLQSHLQGLGYDHVYQAQYQYYLQQQQLSLLYDSLHETGGHQSHYETPEHGSPDAHYSAAAEQTATDLSRAEKKTELLPRPDQSESQETLEHNQYAIPLSVLNNSERYQMAAQSYPASYATQSRPVYQMAPMSTATSVGSVTYTGQHEFMKSIEKAFEETKPSIKNFVTEPARLDPVQMNVALSPAAQLPDSCIVDEESKKPAPKKIKTPKHKYTNEQTEFLERMFERTPYLRGDDRKTISDELQLPEDLIKNWYQNRRSRVRRQMAKANSVAMDSKQKITPSLVSALSGNTPPPYVQPAPVAPLSQPDMKVLNSVSNVWNPYLLDVGKHVQDYPQRPLVANARLNYYAPAVAASQQPTAWSGQDRNVQAYYQASPIRPVMTPSFAPAAHTGSNYPAAVHTQRQMFANNQVSSSQVDPQPRADFDSKVKWTGAWIEQQRALVEKEKHTRRMSQEEPPEDDDEYDDDCGSDDQSASK